MMTKVLHLINGEHYAGAERVQDLLALRLPAEGFDCGFACLKPQLFETHRRSQQTPLHVLPMRSRFDLNAAQQLARLLARDGYQVLHAHTVRAALVARLSTRWHPLPIVQHIHSPTREETNQGWRNRLNSFIEERWGWPGVQRLIAVSSSLGQYLQNLGVAPPKIAIVPNGVPILTTHCQWEAPHEGGEWTLGVVALFRPRKGLEVLLNALAHLRAQGRPVRLLAVGGFESPEHERRVREQVDALGLACAVEWTGFTTDVGAHLRRMHLFVVPSLFGEGLPMVLIEAMAAGVPVIASRVQGIPEVLGGDPMAGLTVTPGDVEDLVRAITRVISGHIDARTLAQAGHARQREHYSDESMARGVASVYRDLLTTTSP